MKRIDSVNARPDENGLGKAGFNDNADLPGQDATYVTPGWFNTVQEELCNLLELRGITLNPASKRQLYDLLTTQADLEALADEIETNFIRKSQIVDNLTTNDANKVASARTVKELNDSKLSKLDFDDAYKYMPIPYPKSIPPSGFLLMDGQAITQAQYPNLYGLYGANLPDLRGAFIRGWDNGKGRDTGRSILSYQEDDFKSHTHNLARAENWGVGDLTDRVTTANGNGGSANAVGNTGGGETRPKNIAFNYIVKAG